MKTLDEVIKALEEKPVPMAYTAKVAVQEEDLEDALHYLKEYRELTKELVERNEPLTWDELKTMEGKPVWVEESAENGLWWTYWVIWEHENAVLPEKTYGTTWQAYRKERE